MNAMPIRHVLVACLVLLLAACQRDEAQPPAPAAAAPETAADGAVDDGNGFPQVAAEPSGGAEFPGLVVTTLDGAVYGLAGRRGRWVVVNFWATWCAHCLKEMPELSALDVMREHIEVIGLAYEDTDAETLRMFLEKRPVAFPVAIVDTYDPPRDFPTPRGLPQTCLVAP